MTLFLSCLIIILLFFVVFFCDYSVVLLYWKLERSVFYDKGSSVSKIKTNGEYYQKSDYRLLRINTFFLIC